MSVDRSGAGDVEIVASRRTVVTALPLKAAPRERLAELLDARVLDVRDVVDRVDLVLTPVCSPQTIAKLKRRYEGARLVVVELSDWEFDIDLPGPAKRILRSGADAYLLADSIDELAGKLLRRPEGRSTAGDAEMRQLPSPTVDELIDAFLRESVEYSTRHRAHGQDRPRT